MNFKGCDGNNFGLNGLSYLYIEKWIYVCMYFIDSKTAGAILMKFSNNLQIKISGDPVKFENKNLT